MARSSINDNLEENSNSKSQQGTEIHTFILQNLHMLWQSFLSFLIFLQVIGFRNFYCYLYASHCMYHSWICSNYQCVRNRGLHLSSYIYQLTCSLKACPMTECTNQEQELVLWRSSQTRSRSLSYDGMRTHLEIFICLY
jgi:hypothetical protein